MKTSYSYNIDRKSSLRMKLLIFLLTLALLSTIGTAQFQRIPLPPELQLFNFKLPFRTQTSHANSTNSTNTTNNRSNTTSNSTANTTTGLNNGMTFQAIEWPTLNNSMAGKWGCSGCDPYQGDSSCNASLPLLCILVPQTLSRPYYTFPLTGTGVIADKSFYNGWTGGFFSTTKPVQGSNISSQAAGDSICQSQLGSGWQFA